MENSKIKKPKVKLHTTTDADYLVGGIDDTVLIKNPKSTLIED